MKVLGISGSPRKDHSTDRLVKEVLSTVGLDTEFVSLAGKRIGPCIACLGCVEDNVCKVKDDMRRLRDKIAQADAYVIGAANYYSMLNGLALAMAELVETFQKTVGQAVKHG
ncbi:MAG: flavodoxin family protein, partial [Planctomycetota bacterium]|nr:flavodoxin family protein [Planctomycetota bacterium]